MHVTLAAIHPFPSPQALPLGNAFLKAYLATDEELSASIRVNLCNFFLNQPPEECIAALLAEHPAAVGFSLYLWNRERSLTLARLIRKQAPSTVIFAGGPEATAAHASLLESGAFDFLIIGEGEEPFLKAMAQLRAGKSVAGIAGIARAGVDMLPAKPVRFLDSIPSPYTDGSLDPAAYEGVLWQLSRGCSFTCDFCFDSKGDAGVRRYALERLEEELRLFVGKRVTQVFVLDSTFNQDPKRAKSILRMIAKIAPRIHFHFEVRSEFIDAEMASLFAAITCSLQVGLQSADPVVLKKVRRAFDPDDFAAKIALLNETGVIFGFDLIYGLPGDSIEGFVRSLDMALNLYPNHLDIFPLAVLPGTRLAEQKAALGLDYLDSPPYTLLGSPTFPAGAMALAATLAAACDIFYSRGKAVAWFNAVVGALASTPSALLEEFGTWLTATRGRTVSEIELDDKEIWELQRTFLTIKFSIQKRKKLLPLALDLVDYHYHYAAAIIAQPPKLPSAKELEQTDLLNTRFMLAPSAKLAAFNYEIIDLLEGGEIDLAEFVKCFVRTASFAVVYPRNGEVFTESISEAYCQLLQKLDGFSSVGDLAGVMQFSVAETLEFMEFVFSEGIVVKA